MRLCYRSQERLCSKKGKDISVIKNREGGYTRVVNDQLKKRFI